MQVGDLVDRGRYAPETVELAHQLNAERPATTTFLMGNHEYGLLRHFGPDGPYPSWLQWGGRSTVEQYRRRPKLLAEHRAWLAARPLQWQNDDVLVSHAGLSDSLHALDPAHPDGLLWRRGPLKKLAQLQVVGHTPTAGKPQFDADSNALSIDTGAYMGQVLTAVRLTPTGQWLDTVQVPTHARDLY